MKIITAKQKQILGDNQIHVSDNAFLLAKQYGDKNRLFANEIFIFSLAFFIFLSFVLLSTFLSEGKNDLSFYFIMCVIALLCLGYTIYRKIVYLKSHFYNLLIILDDDDMIILKENGFTKISLSTITSCTFDLNYLTTSKRTKYMKYGTLTLKLLNEDEKLIENVDHVKNVCEELLQKINK